MRMWTRNISFLFLVGASTRSLGLLSGDLYEILSFLGFLVFASTFRLGLLNAGDGGLFRLISAFFLAGAGIALFRWGETGLLPLYVFLSISLLLLFWRRESEDVRHLESYVLALACVAFLGGLVRLLPVLWHAETDLASLLSWTAEKLAEEDRALGATTMAMPLLAALLFLLFVREAAAESRRHSRWIAGALVLVAVHVFYLVFLKYYARWITSHRPTWDWLILNSQHLFLILGSVAFTLIDRGRTVRSLMPAYFWRAGYVSAALFVVAVVVALALAWAPAPTHRPYCVMVYDAGYLNWKIPVHGTYGERSAGMFGMFPSALEAAGLDVIASNDLTLLDSPAAPDCVVMINIQEYLEEEERERIWKFVSEGGGLLCLGDHTGVAGIRGPFNDLLEPVGIRFRFDSSTFFGQGWNEALDFRPHPLNRGVETAEDFQIWVGATLDLDIAARPVVIGRYGYSDIGDAANIERSYLGDRRYNPNELLGDVVLVADARFGKGKVLVFGDTSGYQNLSLVRTLDSVVRSLDYLSAGERFGPGALAQVGLLVLLLLLVTAGAAYVKNPLPIIAAALGVIVGSALCQLATPTPKQLTPAFLDESPEFSFSPTPHVKRELAVMDVSHGGHHTLRGWKDKSIGGLQLNLARNGYFPLLRPEFPYQDLERGAALLVIMAPTRVYSEREIDAIEKFLRSGGRVIISVGFEELRASEGLLNRFGLSVANVPLGRLEVASEGDSPGILFREGWPVLFDSGAPVEVMVSEWNYPLVVRKPVGAGNIILIGDSSFFHDANLETREHYFEGNVAFFRRLIELGKTK
ncbi:MAG: hypothetical protein JSW03_09745 [Candidatus Eiseniibacteriota bacterium]|nr:MAG: hypothetical protein JSW03_09745 [Candidatus Eisenbacteria bacterium]